MKRILFIFLTVILMVFSLCACSPEPVSYTVDGVTYSLPGDLTLEEDKDTAIQNVLDLVDEEAVKSESSDETIPFEEALRDIKYYYHDDYDVSVISMFVPYNNDELTECIAATFVSGDYTEEYTNFTIDGIQGKRGYYSRGSGSDKATTNVIYLLKDGILYSFEIYMLTDNDLPEGFMDDIIDSISFTDDAVGMQNISCGDIQFTIPDNYQALSFEANEDAYDEQWYGQFGDHYTEFGISYILSSEYYGASASELADLLSDAYDLETYERSSSDCNLGTCEFIAGNNADGEVCIAALLDYSGKIYWFEMLFAEEADPQLLMPIINSAVQK